MEYIRSSSIFSEVKFFRGKMISDSRGQFSKPFHGENLAREFDSISEIIYSKSKKNVIRGLHFQIPPQDVIKLVHCVEGEVKDIFLDLRSKSPTFGEHDSIKLNSIDPISVLIPKGFAHGFSVLSDDATVLYLQSRIFDENSDRGISYKELGIDWEVNDPIVSKKDLNLPKLSEFQSPW